MLVLTRKPNQQLHIGNDIVITVVKVRGNTIRLGIEAPKDVRVIRSELEPKPAVAATESQRTPESSGAIEQPAAPAAADEAQDAAEVEVLAPEPLVIQARIQPQASSAAPLNRVSKALRAQGAYAERNLEDCPLCHRAPQDSVTVVRPRAAGLHSYIAAKNVNGAIKQVGPRAQPALGKQAQSQPAAGVVPAATVKG